MNNSINWKIGGEAGYGIMISGLMFSKCLSRNGFHIFNYAEYPSLIRGGHNTYYVRAAPEFIHCQLNRVDILVALNEETIQKDTHNLSEDSGIIFDSDTVKISKELKGRLYPVPLLKLAKEAKGDHVMRNTVGLGASIALMDYDINELLEIIKESFKGKGNEIIEINQKAAQLGYDYIKQNTKNDFAFKLKKIENKKRMVLTGNDALCMGAIKAGCKFLSAYPMTPINSILSFMAAHEKDYNLVVKQPEDEISGINMAIGASFAGVRAMTATSGGGLSLMVESFGLAAMSETPLVVIDGQRPGPATGLPTWTDQADLRFVLHAAQGEFPRIVIAPGDLEECYSIIMHAFNLAEKYQMLVIILTDKYLAESFRSAEDFNGEPNIERGILKDEELQNMADYKRFAITETGISPRAIPGQKNGMFMVTSDEHNEEGYFDEESDNRIIMMDKRFKKLEQAAKEIPEPKLYGNPNADLTIIGWGSVKMPVLESLKEFPNVNFLHTVYVNPFPKKKIEEVLNSSKKTLIIENNKTGQFLSLIKEHIGKETDYKLLKYDGRPFYPEEIADKIKEVLNG